MTHREDLRSLLKGIVLRDLSPTDLLDIDVPAKSDVIEEPGEIGGVRVEFTLSDSGMSKLTQETQEAKARLMVWAARARGGTEGGR